MKYIVALSFILTTVKIYTSTATEILYVLPDNSTNAVSCPSQPCATLNQYVLDNGTLPVVSNVEYHFLPGEHHVPANMKLQNLHNFSIYGMVSNSSSPVVLVGCSQPYLVNIIDSQFVTINNVMLKRCNVSTGNKTQFTNLRLHCCFSCRILYVTLFYFGLTAYNLIGNSYMHSIKIMKFSQLCCQEFFLNYDNCPNYSNLIHNITINQIFIQGYTKYDLRLHINFDFTIYHLNIFLQNSYFYNTIKPLRIKGRYYSRPTQIFIINCTFKFTTGDKTADFSVSPFNRNISFVNCKFHNNMNSVMIKVHFEICKGRAIACELDNATFSMILTTMSLIECQFIDNNNRLLFIENRAPAFGKVNVLLKSLNISHNRLKADIIVIVNVDIYITGIFNVNENKCHLSIMNFQSCNILFSGKIIFKNNHCEQVILLDTYIKVMEYTNITFISNIYHSNVISIKQNAEQYSQPYPYCFIQYIAVNDKVKPENLLNRYSITFTRNYHRIVSKHLVIINFNGKKLHSENSIYSKVFCQYISNCKWLPLGPFNSYDPETINQQILQIDDDNCNYRKHICYCHQNKSTDCSIDLLGTVYPGQTLQTMLCNMHSNDNSTVLYAEVHNVDFPNSACKIAHRSQLINIIGNHSNTVNYTIVSSIPDTNKCKLFLMATPLLNKVYDVFDVELLPCPIGFTLLNGICNCDPILPASIDKCYIDYSTIRRPANTWITAPSQTNNTKYLTSECPMDYCLPYSSNVNLLYPDLQCQFNRTGILCSQCQHHLSMVFGSSRCMECTDVHILISIIVLVAGIVLVVSIYLLNLTVTNGTINGIIFYANIVSINDSVFLLNENVLKPLRVFISFANLDLGIETCFYNGMDSYAKMWLQLFFPFYLIIIAASIIIASRYSYRILRLTYTRSLPVLATLFLLSYTGVLRTVLTVLFSYSTITHLPSGHKQIVWSIDASVPLFGIKFSVLFITCLVLFLLLIPFNITLLFTRYLLQFRIINRFKPLLDAFQGSYKDRYYYWVAVHITLRCIFFGLYGFQIRARLIIAALILIFFIGYHGYIYPYKNKLVNIQEHLLLINLTMMYAVSYQSNAKTFSIFSNVMISLAFIQFCTIVFYHFLTYTCHCDIANKINLVRKIIQRITKRNIYQNLNSHELLDIPERTYNYSEYQDGLVSDDFN